MVPYLKGALIFGLECPELCARRVVIMRTKADGQLIFIERRKTLHDGVCMSDFRTSDNIVNHSRYLEDRW